MSSRVVGADTASGSPATSTRTLLPARSEATETTISVSSGTRGSTIEASATPLASVTVATSRNRPPLALQPTRRPATGTRAASTSVAVSTTASPPSRRAAPASLASSKASSASPPPPAGTVALAR